MEASTRDGSRAAAGWTVDLLSYEGKWLARGAFSPVSQIAVRVWTFDPEEEVNASFFEKRLSRAILYRSPEQKSWGENCGRLVFSEADGLPGLIVDRYSGFLVCQFLSSGAERWKKEIVSCLETLVHCSGIYERSDADVREKEGLAPAAEVLSGETPPEKLEVTAGSCRFLVDIKKGHKTGFYLDQRFNFEKVGRALSGLNVLNCFSYTGGFTVAALKSGAESVTSIDSSHDALELLRGNVEINKLDPERAPAIEGDVFLVLRKYRDEGRSFQAVILDPPRFAQSKSVLENALRGYKDINLLSLKLIAPGGILATFSCSSLVTPDLFQRTIAYAALDAGREVQILERLFQAPDHPSTLSFPEAAYLKGLLMRVL